MSDLVNFAFLVKFISQDVIKFVHRPVTCEGVTFGDFTQSDIEKSEKNTE